VGQVSYEKRAGLAASPFKVVIGGRYCLADLFLTPLIFSIDNAGIIDAIRQAAGTAAGKWTELADCSKSQLAKALGLSTAALYYDRKTTKRG